MFLAVLQGTPVRIVAVSSDQHAKPGFDIDDLNFRRRPYSRTTSYHQSKLCNILFVKELAKRYKSDFAAFPSMLGASVTQTVASGSMFECLAIRLSAPLMIWQT